MLKRLYEIYGKKTVLGALFALVCAVFVVGYFLLHKSATPEVTIVQKATVSVKKVSDIGFSNTFKTVGTVEAVSEAQLQTEAGGRITSVSTEIGKTVAAGTVLATIENSREKALLLQAQGLYESALAGAQTSGVGVDGAKTNLDSARTGALNTYQDAYISADNALHTVIDSNFTITDSKAYGFKLDGRGQTLSLIDQRNTLETNFGQWTASKGQVTTATIDAQLATAHTEVESIAAFIEKLTSIAQDQPITTSFTQANKDSLIATLFATRSSISATLKQIEGSQTAISNATKAFEQAQISGGDSVTSQASAQIKIALGSLRTAQANYEKTLVRTPISGVVNALYLKTGEYASQGQKAAIVANNKGLQIETAVSQEDALQLQIGDVVQIGDSATGTISAIAGAVDPTTGKVALKISVEDNGTLQNGATATITFSSNKKAATTNDITIPLAAVKMTGSGPVVFTVDGTTNTLSAVPIVLGTITGENVVVTSGITADTAIVTDGRGLKTGQEVIVDSK